MTGQHVLFLTQERRHEGEILGLNHTQALPVLTGRRCVMDLPASISNLCLHVAGNVMSCLIGTWCTCRREHVCEATIVPMHTTFLNTGYTQQG